MKSFTIMPEESWYTCPISKTRKIGSFIEHFVNAYYHSDYLGGNSERRDTIGTVENILTSLKNQFHDKSEDVLNRSGYSIIHILMSDLPKILQLSKRKNLTVCVVPRAKAEVNYTSKQLVFKKAVEVAIKKLNGFNDGTSYLVRHKNTRTTHLDRSGYGGDGHLPYPGITKSTCTISENVKGKDILLIDDIYTESINIDEDAIQALFEKGANSVMFYAIGKTASRNF